MINKYALFCSVSRYDSSINQVVDQPVIQDMFYQIDLISDPATKSMVKKGLESNYDITDADSAIMSFHELLNNGLYLHPFFSILYDLWEQKFFDSLDVESIANKELDITDEYVLRILNKYSTSYDKDEEEFIISAIKNQVSCFFESTESLELFIQFSAQFTPLIELARSFPFWGYGFYRAVDMAIKSYGVGYLSDENIDELLNEVGTTIQSKFDSWEQYLASMLLGKLYITCKNQDAQNVFLLSRNEFVDRLYKLISSPNDIFASSNIWENSDLTRLKEVMKNIFYGSSKSKQYLLENGSNAQVEERSISLFSKYILHPLIENKAAHYFTDNWEQHRVFYAFIDQNKGTNFWKKIKELKEKHNLFLSEEEIPLLLINRCLLTTRNFYYVKKRLFREKLEVIPLDKIRFKCVVSSLKLATATVNGKVLVKNDLRRVNLDTSDKGDQELMKIHQANLDKISSILNTACNQLVSRQGAH